MGALTWTARTRDGCRSWSGASPTGRCQEKRNRATSTSSNLCPPATLVAVVDGLGHGAAAAAAAKTAVATLRDHAEEPLIPLVNRCHDALRDTNGVVMSLACVPIGRPDVDLAGRGQRRMSPAPRRRHGPAGSVSACCPAAGWSATRSHHCEPRLSPLHRTTCCSSPPTASTATFTERLNVNDPPQQIADDIMSHYGKETDDALVLVARFDAVTLATETPHDR